jgi:hypothetical protein
VVVIGFGIFVAMPIQHYGAISFAYETMAEHYSRAVPVSVPQGAAWAGISLATAALLGLRPEVKPSRFEIAARLLVATGVTATGSLVVLASMAFGLGFAGEFLELPEPPLWANAVYLMIVGLTFAAILVVPLLGIVAIVRAVMRHNRPSEKRSSAIELAEL